MNRWWLWLWYGKDYLWEKRAWEAPANNKLLATDTIWFFQEYLTDKTKQKGKIGDAW